jgi:hypothetical protein
MVSKSEASDGSDPCFGAVNVNVDVQVVVDVDGRFAKMDCAMGIRIRPRPRARQRLRPQDLFKIALQIGSSGIPPDPEA